jgi:hypothetical protein
VLCKIFTCITGYNCERAAKLEKKNPTIFEISYLVTSKQSGRFFSIFFCLLRISELYLKQDKLDFFASDVLLIRNLKECTPWREASTSSDLS